MKRITHRDSSGNVPLPVSMDENGTVTLAFDRLAEYEDAMPLERAQELAQAEKDGRLVVLPPNDPLTPEEMREVLDELTDAFIDYVTGGVQNAAPYCINMRPECCDRPGWCTGYSKECRGFFPKAAGLACRRKLEEV